MNKAMSNSDVMNMFKAIDDIMASSIGAEAKAAMVKQKQDEIVENLSFLVYNKTKMYKNFSNYEDLVQEGFVGLVKAVQQFKHEKFPNFFVYSNQWITHYIKRSASRFDIVYNPDHSRVVYAEVPEDEIDPSDGPEEILFKKERREQIQSELGTLPEREKSVINEIFGLKGESKTLREIGPALNLTHERVRQIKNSALNKLKKNSNICELNNEFN